MNRPVLIAVATVVAVAAIGYGAYRTGLSDGQRLAADKAAPDATTAGRRVLYWHDPMNPGPRFDKPGKSPFMDMQLVPVYADDAGTSGVRVRPRLAQDLGLRTATVRRGTLTPSLEAQGNVVANERTQVVVQSRAMGYVEQLYVRAALDPVTEGQRLASVFAPDWAGALAEYRALREAGLEPALLAATRERLRLLSVPESAIREVEHGGAPQARFTLTAPRSGVVEELGVREGAQVQPGQLLFRIVDLSSVWVEANVPEAQAGALRVGAPVIANADAYPGTSFAGTLAAVLPQVDAATRTVRIRLEVANRGLRLKPGMFVRVVAQLPAGAPQMLVPQEAVIATGRRNVVIVAHDDERFEPVEVSLGHAVGPDVEVLSGLIEGQRVVTSGQFLIDSEASLKAALPRIGAEAQPQPVRASYHTEGRIEQVDGDEVTIAHAPVAALKWPAMTMSFKRSSADGSTPLKVGDHVAFDFVEDAGEYRLTRITPAADTGGLR